MLTGNKCLIRPLSIEDLDLTYKWSTEQNHLGSFMGAKMIYKDKYKEKMKNVFSDNSSFYAIIEDTSNHPLGLINYFQTKASDVTLEIGILIAKPEARGKGIGEEALRLFIDYIFNTQPQIRRIQFKTRIDNKGMKRIGEKVGFKIEGTLRNYKFDQGEIRDYHMASIIRENWKE